MLNKKEKLDLLYEPFAKNAGGISSKAIADLQRSAFKFALKEKEFYKSKKFWATIICSSFPILNTVLKLGLSIEEITASIFPFVSYVLGLSYKESKGGDVL